MRIQTQTALLLCALLFLGACSKKESEAPIAPAPAGSQTKEAPAAIEAPPTPPPPAPVAPEPPPEDPLHAKLVGTKWALGGFHAEFISATKVRLSGGTLKEFYPKGYEGKYTYTDGNVEVSVMGQSRTAVWDGEALAVDGVAGERVE